MLTIRPHALVHATPTITIAWTARAASCWRVDSFLWLHCQVWLGLDWLVARELPQARRLVSDLFFFCHSCCVLKRKIVPRRSFTFSLVGFKMTWMIGPDAHAVFFRANDDQVSPKEAYQFMVPVFGKVNKRAGWRWLRSRFCFCFRFFFGFWTFCPTDIGWRFLSKKQIPFNTHQLFLF